MDESRVRVITREHEFEGVIRVAVRKLADRLTDDTTMLLQLNNVAVCRLGAGTCVAKLPGIFIRKSHIGLVVVTYADEHDDVTLRHWYSGKETRPAYLVAHGHDLHGKLHLKDPGQEVTTLVEEWSPFFPVTEAVVTFRDRQRFEAPVIFVNRDTVSALHVSHHLREETPESEDADRLLQTVRDMTDQLRSSAWETAQSGEMPCSSRLATAVGDRERE